MTQESWIIDASTWGAVRQAAPDDLDELPMVFRNLFGEMRGAYANRLYMLTAMTALALPDICATAEKGEEQFAAEGYIPWVERYFVSHMPDLSGGTIYRARCAALHSGRLDRVPLRKAKANLAALNHPPLVFAITPDRGPGIERTGEGEMVVDLARFCTAMERAVKDWHRAVWHESLTLEASLKRMFRYQQGSPPGSAFQGLFLASPLY